MQQNRVEERFRIDIGRADGGRSFVRVTDTTTGDSRIQVGLDGEPAEAVGQRLAAALLADIQRPEVPSSARSNQ